MKLLVLIFVCIFAIVACDDSAPVPPVDEQPVVVDETVVDVTPSDPEPITEVEEIIEKIREVTLWATYYNLPEFNSIDGGVAIRDMRGNSLGVRLSRANFCVLAMEGSGIIDGKTYNYAGTTSSHKVSCKHRSSGRVKFKVSKFAYGEGNRSNPLVPFHSIACDQSRFKFGQRFYIPAAKNVVMPNGEIHNGIFKCDDVGGLIKTNHIDVFIGSNYSAPFDFIKSNRNKTFQAFLIK